MRVGLLVAIISGVYFYLQNQMLGSLDLNLASRTFANIAVAIPFIVLLIPPLLMWSHKDRRANTDSGLYFFLQKSFHFMVSYLNYLFFAVLIRDLLFIVLNFADKNLFQYNLTETVIIAVLPLILFLVGNAVVRSGPKVFYHKLSAGKLSTPLFASWQGFKIVQLSDIHLGLSATENHIRKVVEKTNALNPDVIVITGDLFDGTIKSMQGQFNILKNLKANTGIYFCSGNHEYYWPYQTLTQLLDEMNMQWLNNSKAIVHNKSQSKISFYGIPDPQARGFGHDGPDFKKLDVLLEKDTAEYRILLSHQPSLFDIAANHGFDLQLSGHTHGGQFFPWNFLIHFFQKYNKGFYQKDQSLLYVNQGTTYWGPADRLGTTCEITCFEIKS